MWEELIQISMRRVRNFPETCQYACCEDAIIYWPTPRYIALNEYSQSWETALMNLEALTFNYRRWSDQTGLLVPFFLLSGHRCYAG